MAYVYILQGTSGRCYIGSTENVVNRLERHNSGRVYSTKRLGIPLQLVVFAEFESIGKAREVEARLKRWKNASKAIIFLEGV